MSANTSAHNALDSTLYIDGKSHRFKMLRIHAGSVFTKMIQAKAFGNLSICELIGKAMGEKGASGIEI
jgi:hypothetical protein